MNNSQKTPVQLIQEIIEFLESKGIDKETIKQFLDEMQNALKAELAATIAESIDPKRYQKAVDELLDDASEKDVMQKLGVSDDDTNQMLVGILMKYKDDIIQTLNE